VACSVGPGAASDCCAALALVVSLTVMAPLRTRRNRGKAMPSVRVLAAVIRHDDQVLICRRPVEKRHGGLWEFPGGKVENGETSLQAVTRELMEELGVDVTRVESPLYVRADEGSDFVIEFVPTMIRGTPATLEHSEIAWVSVGDLVSFDLAPSDRAFAEEYLLKC